MEEASGLCDILQQATKAIAEAMPRLRNFADIHHWTVEVNRLENEGDRLSRQAIAGLFDGGIDPDELPAADSANPARQFERNDLASRLTLALEDLPAPQREAFLLAEEGGLSLEEIAAATATGRETVKSRLRYAVGKLRHSLQDLL